MEHVAEPDGYPGKSCYWQLQYRSENRGPALSWHHLSLHQYHEYQHTTVQYCRRSCWQRLHCLVCAWPGWSSLPGHQSIWTLTCDCEDALCEHLCHRQQRNTALYPGRTVARRYEPA